MDLPDQWDSKAMMGFLDCPVCQVRKVLRERSEARDRPDQWVPRVDRETRESQACPV